MKKKIPAHILYPGIVVGILLMSITANIVLILMASNDQGPEIIDDYYEEAAHYNDVIAQRAETDALGWTTRIVAHPPTSPENRDIDLILIDADQAPIIGATGKVTLFNPAKAKPLSEADLQPISDGLYRVHFQGEKMNRKGLYDLVVSVEYNGHHYNKKFREDI